MCFLCLTQEILFYAKVKDSCLDFLRIAFVFHTELFNPSFVVKFTSFSVAFPLRGYFESSPSSKATSAVSPPSPCAPSALGTLRVRQGDFSVSGALFVFVTLEVLFHAVDPGSRGLIPLVFRIPSVLGTPLEPVRYVLCLAWEMVYKGPRDSHKNASAYPEHVARVFKGTDNVSCSRRCPSLMDTKVILRSWDASDFSHSRSPPLRKRENKKNHYPSHNPYFL